MDATRNRTILLLIAAFAVSVCLMTYATIIGTIASVLVLLLMIDQVLLTGRFTKTIYRAVAIRHPFDVYFQPIPDDIDIVRDCCVIHSSGQAQEVCFTLYMRQELSLQYIRLEFHQVNMAKGKPPSMEGLFDWYLREQTKSKDVTVEATRDGALYWRYPAGRLRWKDSRTTIGIRCFALEPFDGVLRFSVTFNEMPRKSYDILFKVT